jgi:two-component system, OmpR family, phosphate regulon sensor histidine kinase PhoR
MLFQKWAIGLLLVLAGFVFFLLLGLRLLVRGEYTGIQIEVFIIVGSTIFYLLILWWQFRFLTPMVKIAEKSRALIHGDEDASVWTHNPFVEDEDDDWTDLEESLNRIHARLVEGQEKLSRERQGIQTLVHSSGDPILAIDKDGFSVFFNSRLESLVGREKLFQKHVRVSEIFREPEILDAFQRVLKTGNGERVSVQMVPVGESLAHFFSLNIVPLLRQADADVYGAMGLFHDITELKRAEMIKIDFVANVSHELRTPLTSVKGYLQAIEEDIASGQVETIKPQLAIVSSNVNRLISLVQDLLDLSSLETGADLEITTVDVDDVTESVLEQLKDESKKKNIEIETLYEVGTLNADRKRIEQVLVNLIQNAIKYIPEKHHVWVKWESSEDGSVILRVADDGPGIPPEHLPRIFERFYRVDSARSRALGGTGLGLAIVKHIVQRHGGTISVKSEVGKGAEFICRFPSGV